MPFRSVRRSSLITSAALLLLLIALLSYTSVNPRASLAASSAQSQAGATFQTSAKHRRDFVPGNVIVRYRDEAAAKVQQRAATRLMTDEGAQLDVRVEALADASLIPGLRIAKVAPEHTLDAVAALKMRPDVLYAEPDYILHRDDLPNDTRFGELYGLKNTGQSGGTIGADIHAQQAWDITHGSSSVVVGVVDEGIDVNHQDLQANVWTNPAEIPGNGIDDDGDGFVDDVNGWDFAHNDNSVFDFTGTSYPPSGYPSDADLDDHATHVAGTIGAVGNNGVGVVGVNWQVKIISLKFLTRTGGSTSDAIRAYNYAKMLRELWVNTNGAKGANIRVLNNSYGGDGYSQAQVDAINALGNSGILFVAAAGNNTSNTDVFPHYPSSYDLPNVISVAATNNTDQLAAFSNYGASSVFMGAPGQNILSTTPLNTYTTFSGTSMATPHIAGAAALLLAKYPNLSVQQLRGLLLFNGDSIHALSTKTLTGRRLNVFSSLQAGAENDTTPPGTVTGLALVSQQGQTLNLQWTASGDDGASGQASLYEVSFVDASGTIQLAKLKPATSGSLQTVTVKIPFRHTTGNIKVREFDNVGNEGTPAQLPITISADISDPYTFAEAAPQGGLSTGSPIGLKADDHYAENYPLPFSFPFYGQVYTSVTISTNGALYFSTPPKRANGDADEIPTSVYALNHQKMIAVMWDDLRTDRRPTDDVYVSTPDLNRIIFRWQGVNYNDDSNFEFPVNCEVELRRDGTIITRYGSGNTNITPVVGISGGDPEAYTIVSHTSESATLPLTNAQTVTFALRTPPPATNPIDDARVFILQHYRDFLNREPDGDGWNYWTGQITQCGSDATCIHNQRIGVSAAFYIELEFQKTGSVIYRMYRAAYGASQQDPLLANISYSQFTADRPLINPDQSLIQQSTVNFANTFVQRAQFKTAYPDTMSNTEFVNKLYDTAGLTPYTNERQAQVTAMSTGKTRAQVLLDVIEIAEFKTREFNRGFVLMQYFGYLRRDVDTGGYDFWLDVLNRLPAPNNFRNMVCAFITSDEYQKRFGTIISRHNSDCSSN